MQTLHILVALVSTLEHNTIQTTRTLAKLESYWQLEASTTTTTLPSWAKQATTTQPNTRYESKSKGVACQPSRTRDEHKIYPQSSVALLETYVIIGKSPNDDSHAN